MAVLFDTLSYLLSACVFGRLRGIEQRAREAADDGRAVSFAIRRTAFNASFRAGVAAFRGVPMIPRLAVIAAALNVGGSGLGALYTWYALNDLGLSPGQVGLTFTVYSGAAVSAVFTGRTVVKRLGAPNCVALFAPIASVALLLIPAAEYFFPLPTLVAYEAIFGYSATVWAVASATMYQQIVPSDQLGRVISLSRTLSVLAIPVGAVTAGVLTDTWGMQPTLTCFAMLAITGTATVAVRIACSARQSTVRQAEPS